MKRADFVVSTKAAAKKTAESVKTLGSASIDAVQTHGPKVAEASIKLSRNIAKTKGAQRVATGAAAGAAIAAAIPFVPVATGAILGAGVLVLIKSMKDAD